tara:strand:+ start:137 stop:463 length:327 start_codon:yes stop_codon:yes gene_type:complete
MKTQEIEYYYLLDNKYEIYETNKKEFNIKNIETKYKMTIEYNDFFVGFKKWYRDNFKEYIIERKKGYKKRKKEFEKQHQRKYPLEYRDDFSGTNIEDYIIHLIKENNL